MRYVVSVRRRNSAETLEQYPNLTAPIHLPLVGFEYAGNLRQLPRDTLKRRIETELTEVDGAITDKSIGERETVVVFFNEPIAGDKEVAVFEDVWIPPALRNEETDGGDGG